MKKHKIFTIAVIILSIVVLVISISLYWRYNLYKTKNAFYFSYKNHESLAKQTDALTDSVTVKDMNRAGIKSSSNDGSKIATWIEYKNYEFMPRNSSEYPDISLGIGIKGKDGTFYFDRGFKKTDGSMNNYNKYKSGALKAYKEALKKTYDHWQIKYKFPFVNE